ncbi:MAG: hypothetical protein JNL90_11855 [Planctomycetes bacterium]|nr:hypothetical protein [Planctomycetota bacterium]
MKKLIHYVWMGSAILNTEENPDVGILATWARLNPDWKVNLWVVHKLLDKRARQQIATIGNNFHIEIRDCVDQDKRVLVGLNDQFTHELFTKYPNYGAASDILRVAILIKEGGLYVDHEIVPKVPLGNLNASRGLLVHFVGGTPTNDILYSDCVAHSFFVKYRERLIERYDTADPKVLKLRRTDKELKNQTTQDMSGPGLLWDVLQETGYTSLERPTPAEIRFPDDRIRVPTTSATSWL